MGSDTSASIMTALAPGFRFHPSDEELVGYYLKRKVCGKTFRVDAISDVDVYKFEPWELQSKSRLKGRDKEWYFFTALDKKYGSGERMSRTTGTGYWKGTGKDRMVHHDNRIIGTKRTFVFYSDRAPGGKRSDWVMHEYRIIDKKLERAGATQEAYAICKVFHKSGLGRPHEIRYAPFVEKEWEDDKLSWVPGIEPLEDKMPGDDVCTEANNVQQSSEEDLLDSRELPRETENHVPVSEGERLDELEAPFPIIQCRRRKQANLDSNHQHGSDNSTATACDDNDHHTSSTTTSAAETAYRENPVPLVPDLNSSPPSDSGCAGHINSLQNEIHRIGVERETMKLEMQSAQAMIKVLNSRIEYLCRENADLKRFIGGGYH